MSLRSELDEMRKRYVALEQRVESLENVLADKVEANLLAKKTQKRRDSIRDPKWNAALADCTTIHGLKKVLTESHKILRPAWIVLFIAAVGSTAYYIHKVIRILRQNEYDYPVMLLCPDMWLNADKALAMNLTKPGLQYALGFLINYNLQKAPYTIHDYKQAKKDFENWWESGNGAKFDSLADFFKYVPLDGDDFVTKCSYCPNVADPPPFAKVIMNEGVCYNLSLPPIDGRVSLTDLEYLHVKVPMLSKGYLAQRNYWKYIINPDLYMGMSDTHYLQVFPNHSNTIRVMPYHFVSLPTSKCVTPQMVQSQNYSQSACVADCFMNSRPNMCRPYSLFRSDSIPADVTKVCNTAPGMDPDYMEEKEGETQILATPTACIEQCPSLCEKWVFENSVEVHKLAQDEEDEGITSFYFIKPIVHYGGILSHEEVPTYSFDTLVSNIGGQMGLWLGASMMSLIELVMFVVTYCWETRR